MKKALIIGALVLAAAVIYFASTKPSQVIPKDLTETAETLTSEKTAQEPPAEATAMTRTAEEAEAPAAPAEDAAAGEAPAEGESMAMTRAAEQPESTTPEATPTEPDVAYVMSERSIGDASAPVTVIEYASLTCPHCANFSTKMLPEIKAKLIDTGKMRLIFRDFPLDSLAMKAAKMARCAPKDKYFDLIEVIFRNRDRWLTAAIPEKALMQYGVLAGMGEDYIRKCFDSTELEQAIGASMKDAQDKFDLKSTPSFVFNYGAKVVSGEQTYNQFEEVLSALYAGAAAPQQEQQ